MFSIVTLSLWRTPCVCTCNHTHLITFHSPSFLTTLLSDYCPFLPTSLPLSLSQPLFNFSCLLPSPLFLLSLLSLLLLPLSFPFQPPSFLLSPPLLPPTLPRSSRPHVERPAILVPWTVQSSCTGRGASGMCIGEPWQH